MWLGRCHVYTGFGARAPSVRELFSCDVILIDRLYFQKTTVFFFLVFLLYIPGFRFLQLITV